MSRSAEITLAFGGEDRVFRLSAGRLRALQEKCDAGPFELVQRMAPYLAYAAEQRAASEAGRPGIPLIAAMLQAKLGTARVDDIRETIYQGLIGGGMAPNAAAALVREYVDERPLLESLEPAASILLAAIAGVPDEAPAGEP